MSNLHTPGPWAVDGSCIYAPDGAILAQVHNPGATQNDYPLLPNRNLMAAAPDLLEACRALLAAAPHDGEGIQRVNACNQARAAIAKAEGKP